MHRSWFNRRTTQASLQYICVAGVFVILFGLLLRLQFISKQASEPRGGSRPKDYSHFVDSKSLITIQNSTLGFGRIFAINLPERTDHHDSLVLASSVSAFDVDFIAGVRGSTVLDKVLPAKHASGLMSAVKGSWRAHINAISRVLEQGLESALIIEDDIDWDVRLKQQLQDFALASRHLLVTKRGTGTVKLKDLSLVSTPSLSPYGDGWDVLWLGHCGMELPEDTNATMVVHENDETVVQIQHQRSWDALEQRQGTCSLAYAVSQQGARKILFALGLRQLDMAFDLMLREWCQQDNDARRPVCIGVHPQLFDHHRRIGPDEIDSDIALPSGQFRDNAYTLNIRWSVHMNMDKLLMGDTSYDDQWPDSQLGM